MSKKKARVGFDFDGVVAYNPFRILRFPTKLLKQLFFQQTEVNFYYPKTRFEQWIWIAIHETSFFPAIGFQELKQLLENDEIEGYLLTSRYACLENSLFRWLKRHGVDRSFKGYFLNKKNEQPHLFKEKMLSQLKLDHYIDDNLDIVIHLDKRMKERKIPTQIHWIYNIVDHFHPYPFKHPHLKWFLEEIFTEV